MTEYMNTFPPDVRHTLRNMTNHFRKAGMEEGVMLLVTSFWLFREEAPLALAKMILEPEKDLLHETAVQRMMSAAGRKLVEAEPRRSELPQVLETVSEEEFWSRANLWIKPDGKLDHAAIQCSVLLPDLKVEDTRVSSSLSRNEIIDQVRRALKVMSS